jgi:hypothetical protein
VDKTSGLGGAVPLPALSWVGAPKVNCLLLEYAEFLLGTRGAGTHMVFDDGGRSSSLTRSAYLCGASAKPEALSREGFHPWTVVRTRESWKQEVGEQCHKAALSAGRGHRVQESKRGKGEGAKKGLPQHISQGQNPAAPGHYFQLQCSFFQEQ